MDEYSGCWLITINSAVKKLPLSVPKQMVGHESYIVGLIFEWGLTLMYYKSNTT